jgi:hypothetical protein
VRLAQLAECPITPVRIEGVRAQGDIYLPVFLPARARVHSYDSLMCEGQDTSGCLERLQSYLDAPEREVTRK